MQQIQLLDLFMEAAQEQGEAHGEAAHLVGEKQQAARRREELMRARKSALREAVLLVFTGGTQDEVPF